MIRNGCPCLLLPIRDPMLLCPALPVAAVCQWDSGSESILVPSLPVPRSRPAAAASPAPPHPCHCSTNGSPQIFLFHEMPRVLTVHPSLSGLPPSVLGSVVAIQTWWVDPLITYPTCSTARSSKATTMFLVSVAANLSSEY